MSAVTVEVDPLTTALWRYQGEYTYAAMYEGTAWARPQIEEAVERVNRGALLLDNDRPSWVENILPAKLDMSDASFCIIGQAYGEYSEYVAIPFGKDPEDEEYDSDEDAVRHGFLTNGIDPEDPNDEVYVPYPLLDRVWVTMLLERQERQQPVVLALPPDEPINDIRKRLEDAKLISKVDNFSFRSLKDEDLAP